MEVKFRKRLLKVAEALRSRKGPGFTMGCFIRGDLFDYTTVPKSWCGTPGCALGHFAMRKDQNLLRVRMRDEETPELHFYGSDDSISVDDERLCDYFGLDGFALEELFGGTGCGNAKTRIEAARYIEKFVKEHS